MSELMGVTLTQQYSYASMHYKYILTYSIDDEPKQILQINISDAFVANATPDAVLEVFYKSLTDKKLDESVTLAIIEWMTKAFEKTYSSSLQWSTAAGVHNNGHAFSNGWPSGPYSASAAMVGDKPVENLAHKLPGIERMVPMPCICCKDKGNEDLYTAIIHLNDSAKWSREEIADWIDKLHDDGIINAEFQSWEETPPQELPKAEPMVGMTKAMQSLSFEVKAATEALESLMTPMSEEVKNPQGEDNVN